MKKMWTRCVCEGGCVCVCVHLFHYPKTQLYVVTRCYTQMTALTSLNTILLERTTGWCHSVLTWFSFSHMTSHSNVFSLYGKPKLCQFEWTHRRQDLGGIKFLHHKLKHFAAWTVASFYNNFHLKLAQYIFNEFFYKAFNSPQFISSGKWLSSMKWWAERRLYIHYLRWKKWFQILKNGPSFSCSHFPSTWHLHS